MKMLAQFEPTILARRYLGSHNFTELYREIMTVVESTADYLDNQGRIERRALSQADDALYSQTSMQLTTQLMQIAAHALILRDVAERKIELQAALDKIVSSRVDRCVANNMSHIGVLPKGLFNLCEAANHLRSRLHSVHVGLTSEHVEPVFADNAVHNSLASLRKAFA